MSRFSWTSGHAAPRTDSTAGQQPRPRRSSDPWEIAGLSVPARGESLCGDGWGVLETERCATIAVVDGAGHGPAAHEVAAQAMAHLGEQLDGDPELPLDSLMLSVHQALRGSRGAVMALCRVDVVEQQLSFCGVGNIGMVCHPREALRGCSVPGMVGYRVRKVITHDTPLVSGSVIVLYSDGLSSLQVSFDSCQQPARQTAEALMEAKRKSYDDATIVVVRMRGAEGAANAGAGGAAAR